MRWFEDDLWQVFAMGLNIAAGRYYYRRTKGFSIFTNGIAKCGGAVIYHAHPTNDGVAIFIFGKEWALAGNRINLHRLFGRNQWLCRGIHATRTIYCEEYDNQVFHLPFLKKFVTL
jgi:hypothetical protein